MMIQVDNLTKRYGKIAAVDDMSFAVERGEIVGLLGPNGAGKTTTMRILACYLPPSGGKATVAGYDVFQDSLEVRRRVGYLPENVPLYTEMRVVEYLNYRGRLKGLRGRELRTSVERVLEAAGLTDVKRRIIAKLSKGYRQRVGLADALVHDPELLILDEPTIGLDPNQIRHIRNLIKNLGDRHTVLLSSHILHEVEMVCERVLIVNEGRIVASGKTEELTGLIKDHAVVILEIRGPREQIAERLVGLDGVEHVKCESAGEWHSFTCECGRGESVQERLFALVSAEKWPVRELRTERKSLEDVFVAVTSDGGEEEAT